MISNICYHLHKIIRYFIGSCQQLWQGRGGVEMGAMKYFGELRGAQNVWRFTWGHQKVFLLFYLKYVLRYYGMTTQFSHAFGGGGGANIFYAFEDGPWNILPSQNFSIYPPPSVIADNSFSGIFLQWHMNFLYQSIFFTQIYFIFKHLYHCMHIHEFVQNKVVRLKQRMNRLLEGEAEGVGHFTKIIHSKHPPHQFCSHEGKCLMGTVQKSLLGGGT